MPAKFIQVGEMGKSQHRKLLLNSVKYLILSAQEVLYLSPEPKGFHPRRKRWSSESERPPTHQSCHLGQAGCILNL